MNKLIANNIIGFMSRVQLQGVEVPAYHEAMCELQKFAHPPKDEPLSFDGNEAESIPCKSDRSVKVDGVDVPLSENGKQTDHGLAGVITENSDGSVNIVGLRV